MLFNKAIAILAVASIKQGMSASAEEEKRLRGMNTITISSSNDGGVNKYVATNHGILPMDQESIILKDDTKPQVKMASQVQIDAYEEAVRKYHDRPIEFIPRSEAGTTYGGVNLMDMMKKREKESSVKTHTATTAFPIHLRSGVKLADVSCGGHRRDVCANCPLGDDGVTWNGAGWCNGDCTWDAALGECQDVTQKIVCNVSCGGHCATDCAGCPMGNGAGWCNGDCLWDFTSSTCNLKPAKTCNAAGTVKAPSCTECSISDCGSSQCEAMPALTAGSSPSDCRYVLDNTDARSASTFLNYDVPLSVSQPAWWFNKLDIVKASSSTFFSTNGHRFGYAGFQVSETNPLEGRVLFSIWDQGGCDKAANSNCPANQVAKTVACGSGIKCTDFGGEGTGRKSIVYSDTLPILGKPYYIVTWARSVGKGTYRMQYSSFFYVPGDQKWDSSTAEGAKTYTLTSPGWRFLSTIEVGTDNTEQWYMSSLYSFLEQWTGKNGLDKRSALYGPSFLAGVTGDFVQIGDCYFRHGTAENYKHVNAFRDAATGSLGMEMGESVTRAAYNNQLFKYPAASIPPELTLFIPIKKCLSDLSTSATTLMIEACLTATSTSTPIKKPTNAPSKQPAKNPTPTSNALPTCLVKKVRIEGTTTAPLNIVEVKVFSNGVDVASQGTATQSSTYLNNESKFGAAEAIDAKPSDFSNTAISNSPAWWQLSLQNTVAVQSIEIDNRACVNDSSCLCRMTNANLKVYDANGVLLATKNLGNTCSRSIITERFACAQG